MFWLSYVIGEILALAGVSISCYSLIIIDYLQQDYLNPIDACHRLNRWVPVDVALQLLTTFIFLFYGHFFFVLWNLPLCCLAVYLYMNQGNLSDWGIYDPTRILRRDVIDFTKNLSFFKVMFYAVSGFTYFAMTISVVLYK